jgi:hypothetical protein
MQGKYFCTMADVNTEGCRKICFSFKGWIACALMLEIDALRANSAFCKDDINTSSTSSLNRYYLFVPQNPRFKKKGELLSYVPRTPSPCLFAKMFSILAPSRVMSTLLPSDFSPSIVSSPPPISRWCCRGLVRFFSGANANQTPKFFGSKYWRSTSLHRED